MKIKQLKAKCIFTNTYLSENEDGSFYISKGLDDMISLTLGKIYDVSIEDDEFYRVIDDTEEDYLYPKYMFQLIKS